MKTMIGLTGGTGCGKSTAATYLQKKGAFVIDADEIARRMTAPGTPTSMAVLQEFPEAAAPDGSFSRKRLGALVFSDPEKLAKLNAITHPAIIREIRGLIERTTAPLMVLDAPLLFQSGLDDVCTVTVGFLADKTTRIHRIMERDGLDEAGAKNRIASQPEDEYFRSRATYIIENNGEVSAVYEQIESILKELSL